MTETITREQARTVVPKLIDHPSCSGTVTVTDNDKPILVIVSADEYERLTAYRRQGMLRSAILTEWERKTAVAEWDRAFETFDELSRRMETLGDDEIDQLLSEAISAARTHADA
jgi:PHD/YefM family antitoxin component YafN of YafNO toxin-antitoxin module